MRLGWSEQAVAAGQDSGDVSFLSPWIESWRQLAVERSWPNHYIVWGIFRSNLH
jgi:hypothetical protein